MAGVVTGYLAGRVSWSRVFMKARPAPCESQVGIVDGGRTCSAEKPRASRVGLELRWSTVELAGMAQDHSGAAVHGLNHAADLHIHVAVLAQFADLIAVFPEADDGETAGVVGCLRVQTSRKRVPSGSWTTS